MCGIFSAYCGVHNVGLCSSDALFIGDYVHNMTMAVRDVKAEAKAVENLPEWKSFLATTMREALAVAGVEATGLQER